MSPEQQRASLYWNLPVYLLGVAISNVGSFSQLVAVSLLVLDMSESGFALGATMGLQAVPMLLLLPWVGVILDRFSVRRVIATTALVGCVQAFAMAGLAFAGAITIPWVLALTVVLGVVQSFDRTGAQTFLSELVSRDTLPRAASLGSTIQAVGRLGGPALAAVLYYWQGAPLVFFVNGLSYLVVILALVLLKKGALFPRHRRPGQQGSLLAAVRVAKASPILRPVLAANVVVGLFTFNFPIFFASLSKLTFQQPELFGIAESINAVTAIIGGVLLARFVKKPSMGLVAGSGLGLGIALLWVALSPTPWVFLASMPYFGVVVVAYHACTTSLIQYYAPREMTGRMMSLHTLGLMGTTPIGGLIVGWIIDAASPRVALGVGAATAFLVGSFLMLRGWTYRTSNQPEAAPT